MVKRTLQILENGFKENKKVRWSKGSSVSVQNLIEATKLRHNDKITKRNLYLISFVCVKSYFKLILLFYCSFFSIYTNTLHVFLSVGYWKLSTKFETCGEKINDVKSVPPVIEPFSFQDGLAEGMRTRTICGVSRGDSPLRLIWLKDGEILLPSLGANVSSLDQYTSILSIPSLSHSHSGEYTCVASNQASEVKYTASLQVKGNVSLSRCERAKQSVFRMFDATTILSKKPEDFSI